MFGRLIAPALLLLFAFPARAQDGQADLKATAGSAAVKEDLAGPDGCSVQLGDPSNWKLICIGTSAYDFNDADEIKDATRAATLDAKAALARFLNERLSTTESIEKVVSKQAAQATGGGRNVSKTSMQTQITSIKSSADAIVRGVIVIESEQIWSGSTGTVRVKVGQSQKTMAVAGQFARANAETASTCNDGIDNDGDGFIDRQDPDCVGAGAAPAGSDPGPAHTTRTSSSDF